MTAGELWRRVFALGVGVLDVLSILVTLYTMGALQLSTGDWSMLNNRFLTVFLLLAGVALVCDGLAILRGAVGAAAILAVLLLHVVMAGFIVWTLGEWGGHEEGLGWLFAEMILVGGSIIGAVVLWTRRRRWGAGIGV